MPAPVFQDRQHLLLAKMFKSVKPEPNVDGESRTRLDQWIEMVHLFEEQLKRDNPSFDPKQFRYECAED